MTDTPKRYFLDTDNNDHWYVVPVELKAEWDAWMDLPGDDERVCEAPEGIVRLEVSHTLVTFTDPVIE